MPNISKEGERNEAKHKPLFQVDDMVGNAKSCSHILWIPLTYQEVGYKTFHCWACPAVLFTEHQLQWWLPAGRAKTLCSVPSFVISETPLEQQKASILIKSRVLVKEGTYVLLL